MKKAVIGDGSWSVTLSVLLSLLVCLSAIVPDTFPPTPETESAFLKNYTPTNVLNRLNDGQASYSGGKTAGASYESVAHTATFDRYFALCSEKFMSLMDALRDEVATELVGNGARILSQVG